jgi:hypothetical protein
MHIRFIGHYKEHANETYGYICAKAEAEGHKYPCATCCHTVGILSMFTGRVRTLYYYKLPQQSTYTLGNVEILLCTRAV